MFYIGSTNSALSRKKEHFKALSQKTHHNWSLQSDFLRYGSDNFIFEVIIDGFENRQQMLLKEYEIINKTFLENYNIDRICPVLDKEKNTDKIKKSASANWKLHRNNKKSKKNKLAKPTKHADFLISNKSIREERRQAVRLNPLLCTPQKIKSPNN